MSFDQHSDLPIIQPQKPGTKVNISMGIAIVAFLLIMAGVFLWIWKQSGRHTPPAQTNSWLRPAHSAPAHPGSA